jgi:hypothetical protein
MILWIKIEHYFLSPMSGKRENSSVLIRQTKVGSQLSGSQACFLFTYQAFKNADNAAF